MSFDVVLRSIFSAVFFASVLRISTPIILAALGGLITELSGAINIAWKASAGIRFLLLVFSAYLHNTLSVSPGLRWLGSSGVTRVFSLPQANISSPTAVNILATGVRSFCCSADWRQRATPHTRQRLWLECPFH